MSYQYEITERITILVSTFVNADSMDDALGIVRDQGWPEYDNFIECEESVIVCTREIGKVP